MVNFIDQGGTCFWENMCTIAFNIKQHLGAGRLVRVAWICTLIGYSTDEIPFKTRCPCGDRKEIEENVNLNVNMTLPPLFTVTEVHRVQEYNSCRNNV